MTQYRCLKTLLHLFRRIMHLPAAFLFDHFGKALNSCSDLFRRIHFLFNFQIQHGNPGGFQFFLVDRIIKFFRIAEFHHTNHHPVGMILPDEIDQQLPMLLLLVV